MNIKDKKTRVTRTRTFTQTSIKLIQELILAGGKASSYNWMQITLIRKGLTTKCKSLAHR